MGLSFDLPAGTGLDVVQHGTAAPNFVFDPASGNNRSNDVNPTERLFANGFEQ